MPVCRIDAVFGENCQPFADDSECGGLESNDELSDYANREFYRLVAVASQRYVADFSIASSRQLELSGPCHVDQRL